MDKNKNTRKSSIPYYFRMFLGIGYLAIAAIFLSTKAGLYLLGNQNYGYAFGIACLIYGCFRMYRAVKNWDTPDREL
jgi:hypothetical protein